MGAVHITGDRGSRPNRTGGELYLVAGTSPLADRAVLCRFFASPDFGLRGKPVVVVGDPEHDRFGRSVFHAVGKRPHFLAPLAPVIWVIGEQARHRRGVMIGHGKVRERRKLHSKLAHSESRRGHLQPLAVPCYSPLLFFRRSKGRKLWPGQPLFWLKSASVSKSTATCQPMATCHRSSNSRSLRLPILPNARILRAFVFSLA